MLLNVIFKRSLESGDLLVNKHRGKIRSTTTHPYLCHKYWYNCKRCFYGWQTECSQKLCWLFWLFMFTINAPKHSSLAWAVTMEWTKNRIAAIALHKCGIERARTFDLLKPDTYIQMKNKNLVSCQSWKSLNSFLVMQSYEDKDLSFDCLPHFFISVQKRIMN